MSGRRHHHVPQLLQRSFATTVKKSSQVWVFSKARPNFPTNTINFGVEKDFYAEGGDFSADDELTQIEIGLAPFISALRQGDLEALQDKKTISFLIAHLEVRTRFIREEMSNLLGNLVSIFEAWASDPDHMRRLLVSRLKEEPDLLGDLVKKEFGNTIEANALTSFAIENVESLIDTLLAKGNNSIFEPIPQLKEKLGESIRGKHLAILRESSSGLKRSSKYEELSYQLVNYGDGDLILPDTMLAFLSPTKVSPFCDGGEMVKINTILIPLASDKLLVGSSAGHEVRSADQVCRILASCSLESFIAKYNEPRFDRLKSRIGKNARLMSSTELNSIARTTLREISSKSL